MNTRSRLIAEDDYLAALLTDYEAVRSDDRAWAQLVGTLFAILVALLGALAAALPSLNVFGCSSRVASCHPANGFLLAVIPVAPVAVIAFAAFVGLPGTLRSYYMRGLEAEIRRVIGEREMMTPARVAIPVVSWNEFLLETTSLRRGNHLYRALAAVIFTCVVAVYGGLIVIIFDRVGPALQALMAVFYSAAIIFLAAAVYQATMGGRRLFLSTAASYWERRKETGRESGQLAASVAEADANEGRSESLAAYLIYPRPADMIKWIFVPLAVVLFAATSGTAFRWSPQAVLHFRWPWHDFAVIALATVIFEGLVYAARYQLNDVRDYPYDITHHAAAYRGRLPAGRSLAERRAIVTASLGVAFYRTVLAFALVAILAPRLIWWATLAFALVVASTAIYEFIRQRGRRQRPLHEGQTVDLVALRSPWVWATWIWVGAGYVIRGFVAWRVAVYIGAKPSGWVIGAGLVFLAALGIVLVTETWALEATSFLRWLGPNAEQIMVDPRAEYKPHVIALAAFMPHLGTGLQPGRASDALVDGMNAPTICPTTAPVGDPLRRLVRRIVGRHSRQIIGREALSPAYPCSPTNEAALAWRTTFGAPWFWAFTTATIAAGVVAVATAGDWPRLRLAIAVFGITVVAIAASALLEADLSRVLLALLLAGGSIAEVTIGGRPWAAGVPLAAVILTDAVFRASSYQALVTTTRRLGVALRVVPKIVAAATLGESSKLFGKSSEEPAHHESSSDSL